MHGGAGEGLLSVKNTTKVAYSSRPHERRKQLSRSHLDSLDEFTELLDLLGQLLDDRDSCRVRGDTASGRCNCAGSYGGCCCQSRRRDRGHGAGNRCPCRSGGHIAGCAVFVGRGGGKLHGGGAQGKAQGLRERCDRDARNLFGGHSDARGGDDTAALRLDRRRAQGDATQQACSGNGGNAGLIGAPSDFTGDVASRVIAVGGSS